MSRLILDTLKSWVENKKKEVWTFEWVQVSLFSPLPPPSLPAHYPCHTGPGPTWHSLVDLIELDIPACLGIVWWHENLPAISVKAEEKRGIGNTSSARSESWRFSGMGGLLWNEGPPVSHCAMALCQVQSWIRPRVSLHLTLRCCKIPASNKLKSPPRIATVIYHSIIGIYFKLGNTYSLGSIFIFGCSTDVVCI